MIRILKMLTGLLHETSYNLINTIMAFVNERILANCVVFWLTVLCLAAQSNAMIDSSMEQYSMLRNDSIVGWRRNIFISILNQQTSQQRKVAIENVQWIS